MVILRDFHTYIYADNQSVLSKLDQTVLSVEEKYISIAYHFVREGATKDEWRTGYISTRYNPEDLVTKPLVGDERKKYTNDIISHRVIILCRVSRTIHEINF